MPTVKPFSYEYPRPALTVDLVVFGVGTHPQTGDLSLRVLLIERGQKPYKGSLALPGGFVEMDEGLDKAAFRELKEETGLEPAHLEQLYTFGAPKRDPRERVVSVAYVALVSMDAVGKPLAGSDAAKVGWVAANSAHELKLAFDHNAILEMAHERLKAKVRYAPIGFDLMPKTFTVGELQRLYEVVSMREFDRSNFRKKIVSLDVLVSAGWRSPGVQLYSFDKEKYDRAVNRGVNFEI